MSTLHCTYPSHRCGPPQLRLAHPFFFFHLFFLFLFSLSFLLALGWPHTLSQTSGDNLMWISAPLLSLVPLTLPRD